MDETRFDQLARNLVTRTDRRRVVRGVSGAVAAGLGLRLSLDATAAKPRKRRSKRRTRQVSAQADANGTDYLEVYYPGWEDPHLTVAIQAGQAVTDETLAAVNDAIALWSQ